MHDRWDHTWWIRRGELVATISSGGHDWPIYFDCDDGTLWEFTVDRGKSKRLAWDYRAESFADTSVPADVREAMRRICRALARGGVDGPRSADDKRLIDLMAWTTTTSTTDDAEWVRGRFLRKELGQITSEEFDPKVSRLVPRFVRASTNDKGDIYSLTLPGLLRSSEGTRVARILEATLRALKRAYAANADTFTLDDLLGDGLADEHRTLIDLTVRRGELVRGGGGSGMGADMTRTWGLPLDIEYLVRCDTVEQYLALLRQRDLRAPWPTAPMRLLDEDAGELGIRRSRGNEVEAFDASLFEERSTMEGVRLFISHASADAALAKKLVQLIEASMMVPNGAMRCTSVDGYKLEGGDVTPQRLREDIHSCSVFIGLITKSSIQSKYVLMELGAAWVLGKLAIPLLAPGADFDDLPGPFRDVHALRIERFAEMMSFVDTVAKRAAFQSTNNMGRVGSAIEDLAREADAT